MLEDAADARDRSASTDDRAEREVSSSFASSARARVRVHVYDLDDGYNEYAYPLGLGIHHSAVEVYGREYAFGYHDEATVTGVFDIRPRSAPPPARFRETIEFGEIASSRDEVEEKLSALRKKFTGPSYDLLKQNCNTFTEEFVKALTGKEVPGYVNRLATLGSVAHDFVPCLLPRSVVGDVRTLPASRAEKDGEDAEDGSGSDDAEQVQLLACPVEEMK